MKGGGERVFDQPTTIIVGAGASLDFGLPSGPALWETVCRKIVGAYDGILEQQRGYFSPADALRLVAQSSLSASALVRSLHPDSANAVVQLRELAETVSKSDVYYSVDDFLLDNPSMTESIKAVVTAHLAGTLYTKAHRRWIRKPELIDKLHNSSGTTVLNWIRMFVGLCRSFLRRNSVRSKVVIVNFNYDRLMETVMRVLWERSEASFPEFDKCFSFVYPHGAFSDLPEEIDDPERWVLKQASSIGFAGGEANHPGLVARKALDDSRTIFMIGFSCSAANASLLGLTRAQAPRIYYQNFEHRDVRLSRVMANLGAPVHSADPRGCADLIGNGFFDQIGREASEPRIRAVAKSKVRSTRAG